MTSDLVKLMETISMLQSEPTPESIIESIESTVHPLLQTMQELKEDGIIESVDPYTIFNQVKEIHREFRDIEEGDLPDRIYWFDEYKTSQIPLSQINLNEFEVDEDLVEDYIEYIKDSPTTMPPIVYDPVAGSVIDGMHRANAYARLGYDSIPAYVGLIKSDSYGESSEPVDETVEEPVVEASPNTLEGSFTPDLVESKTWLAEMLAKGLKGKNAGTIYVLGSWYGNIGIFLQQAGVQFDKLVLVEPNKEWLQQSKKLLDTLADAGKLVLVNKKAEDIVYKKPGVVINTSCNETGPVFLTKLPDNMLCLLQARDNVNTVIIETNSLDEFKELFPLNKTYYSGERQLTDPTTDYDRYMIIGRSGSKLEEEHHTGGSLGLPFPGTYEQEYDMFKSKGPRRITAMTNESEKSFPNLVDTIVKNIPNVNEIYFHGSRAIGKGKRKSDWDILVIVDDSVVGSDYIDTVFALQDIAKEFKNFDIQPSKANNHISRIAKEEGKLLYSTNQKIDEALDSSYPYEFKNNAYYFITDAGTDYKVTFKGDKKVEVSFMARGENNQPKDDITGTGDSRKVFGTVINIVKDYVGQHQPDILMFAADNNEPSRIKLYNMLASQAGKALPGYNFVKTLKGSLFTTFYLTRDNIKVPKLDTVKNVAGRVLDKVVED